MGNVALSGSALAASAVALGVSSYAYDRGAGALPIVAEEENSGAESGGNGSSAPPPITKDPPRSSDPAAPVSSGAGGAGGTGGTGGTGGAGGTGGTDGTGGAGGAGGASDPAAPPDTPESGGFEPVDRIEAPELRIAGDLHVLGKGVLTCASGVRANSWDVRGFGLRGAPGGTAVDMPRAIATSMPVKALEFSTFGSTALVLPAGTGPINMVPMGLPTRAAGTSLSSTGWVPESALDVGLWSAEVSVRLQNGSTLGSPEVSLALRAYDRNGYRPVTLMEVRVSAQGETAAASTVFAFPVVGAGLPNQMSADLARLRLYGYSYGVQPGNARLDVTLRLERLV